jgi:DNA-directed RNA polymerase subunit RPC12/RpoP
MTQRNAHVFTATQATEADVVVGWLAARGIPARVINEGAVSVLGAVPWTSVAKSATGFEVWVDDENQAQEAKKLLAAHDAELRRKHELGDGESRTVSFRCENCGAEIGFPESAAGHVEVCPICGRHVDVPDASTATAQLDTELPPM